MSAPRDRSLLEQSLQFFGRETARQTHEITNVINIMNELVGLLGDMTMASRSGQPLVPDRVEVIVEKLLKQVKRQEAIVRGVNRLSHSVDVLDGIFGIEELHERVAFLAERHIRLAKATLEVELPHPSPSLEGFLLGHQQAVLAAIEQALDCGGASQALRLKYVQTSGSLAVSVECGVPAERGERADAQEAQIEALVNGLGGQVTALLESGQPLRIGLSFPLANGAGA